MKKKQTDSDKNERPPPQHTDGELQAVGGEFASVNLMECTEDPPIHIVNNATAAAGVDIPGMVIDYLISVHKR